MAEGQGRVRQGGAPRGHVGKSDLWCCCWLWRPLLGGQQRLCRGAGWGVACAPVWVLPKAITPAPNWCSGCNKGGAAAIPSPIATPKASLLPVPQPPAPQPPTNCCQSRHKGSASTARVGPPHCATVGGGPLLGPTAAPQPQAGGVACFGPPNACKGLPAHRAALYSQRQRQCLACRGCGQLLPCRPCHSAQPPPGPCCGPIAPCRAPPCPWRACGQPLGHQHGGPPAVYQALACRAAHHHHKAFATPRPHWRLLQ